MIPLFDRYPALCEKLPHTALADLPTPVEPMTELGRALGVKQLYVKRDDRSGGRYGGNKVRKLEFLLGRAVQERRKEVMTFGGAGSNHALATSLYAQHLGLGSIAILVPQPNARSVRRNLLMQLHAGAELHYYTDGRQAARGSWQQRALHTLRRGKVPFTIPAGGSSALGACGFVNAALELAQQVESGLLPAPDLLYVASGTMGTCVGLTLGLRAAGLLTRVMAVAVTKPPYTSPQRGRDLFCATNTLLHRAAPSFPEFPFPEECFEHREGFLGEAYGLYTPGAVRLMAQVKAHEDLTLEGTYTGKALAALAADAASGALEGKTVLFWDTYNSRDFSDDIAGRDYHALPPGLHHYFEEPVQPLDRG